MAKGRCFGAAVSSVFPGVLVILSGQLSDVQLRRAPNRGEPFTKLLLVLHLNVTFLLLVQMTDET